VTGEDGPSRAHARDGSHDDYDRRVPASIPIRSHGEPIPIRAHTLLCLQGFRGRGYSDAFVAEMRAVHTALAADPDTPVRVLTSPDRLCAACPNLRTGGCHLGDGPHEAHMRAQDEDVLRRLWLTPGDVVPWGRVLERIARSVKGEDLPGICTTCPWLSLGWCAEGIESLRAPAATSSVPAAEPTGPCGA
jgi:hypothetical protein